MLRAAQECTKHFWFQTALLDAPTMIVVLNGCPKVIFLFCHFFKVIFYSFLLECHAFQLDLFPLARNWIREVYGVLIGETIAELVVLSRRSQTQNGDAQVYHTAGCHTLTFLLKNLTNNLFLKKYNAKEVNTKRLIKLQNKPKTKKQQTTYCKW